MFTLALRCKNRQKCISISKFVFKNASISSNGIKIKKEYKSTRPWLDVQSKGVVDLEGLKKNGTLIQGIVGPSWSPKGEDEAASPQQIGQLMDMVEKFAQQNGNGGMDYFRSKTDMLVQNASANQLPTILRRGLLFEQKYADKTSAESVFRQEGFLRCLLQLDPENEEYKSQRLEILPSVDQLTDCQLQQCDIFNEQFRADEALMEESSKMAKLKEYFARIIYNSIVIEGSPLPFQRMRQILHNSTICPTDCQNNWDLEVVGMKRAMELATNEEDGQFKSIEDLNIETVAELHRTIVLDQPESGGKFRSELKRNVGILGVPYRPIQWEFVDHQLQQFFSFLRWASTEVAQGKMHPIEFASLVHFLYVHIHPHMDGNGRLSRLLMNRTLMDYGYPPIIIQNADRANYVMAIHNATLGNIRAFCRYIIQRMKTTLGGFIRVGPYAQLPGDLPDE